MTNLNVRIISDDTAVAIGLKQTLANMFDVEASWTRPSAVAVEPDIAADLFIADAGAFASLPGFFIPKRNRLALLSNSTDDNIGFTLNRHCDEAAFLKQLGDIIEMSRHNRSDGNELSQREIDVLCLLAKGLTNKEIADRLFISINTVLTHRKNISAKLGIRSISGLSVYAIMNGYITDIPDI